MLILFKFVMPLSRQEEFFVPEFSEEQVSIATTEFSHAPSEANRSYVTGIDDTASLSGAGSVRGDSQPNLNSVSDIRHTPDKRVKEDFGGDDQAFFESESEDITTEEDEEQEPVFVKPTKPAPRKKLNAKVTSTTADTDYIRPPEINEL